MTTDKEPYRDDVRELLLAEGWTENAQGHVIAANGTLWTETNEALDSGIDAPDKAWSVAFDSGVPAVIIAGAALAAAPAIEEKDTPDRGQRSGAASTARTEILTALTRAGHTPATAAELLARADLEPRDPDPDPDPDFRETLGGGHALVVEYGDCELLGSCQCGRRFGITTPDASLDTFVDPWERHTHTEVS